MPVLADDDAHEMLHAALQDGFSKWKLYQETWGDLNDDGIKDAAVMMFLEPKDADDRGKAAIAVLLGEKGGTYKIHTQAGGATCVGCGGPKASFTDPMGTLAITGKGILTIDYSGGSREMYDITTKWRFDKAYNRIVMIGETQTVVDTMQEYPDEVMDINYSTLKMTKTVGKKKIECRIPTDLKNQELSAFDYEMHGENLSDIGQNCK